jgi:hypothetical protein
MYDSFGQDQELNLYAISRLPRNSKNCPEFLLFFSANFRHTLTFQRKHFWRQTGPCGFCRRLRLAYPGRHQILQVAIADLVNQDPAATVSA